MAETGFVGNPSDPTFIIPDVTVSTIADTYRVDSDMLSLAGIELDWWEPWGLNRGMKLWAGQQSAKSVLGNLSKAAAAGQNEPWIEYTASTSGRLGVDPMGSWRALQIGWSINEHRSITMLCRPFVELLAFLGLQYFALGGDRRAGFTYWLWHPAPFPIARLAFAGHSRFARARFTVGTEKSGSNTILLAATEDTQHEH